MVFQFTVESPRNTLEDIGVWFEHFASVGRPAALVLEKSGAYTVWREGEPMSMERRFVPCKRDSSNHIFTGEITRSCHNFEAYLRGEKTA